MENDNSKENGSVKIDVSTSNPPEGNWRNIDQTILFDKDQCDLTDCDLKEVYRILDSSEQGLNDADIQERREKFGLNKIEIKERHPIINFLLFMWNPLSWVMEVAALVSIAVSNGENKPPDWPDFLGIVLLLLINATIGFIEEHKAGNAVKALMAALAPECRVKRNGTWSTIAASELVPGDIISVKLGNVIPADGRIVSILGMSIAVDQAALTGESLPVSKKVADKILSSTTCKQGEGEVIVIATGKNTYFGRAAGIVGAARDEVGHLQKILARIGNFCIIGIVIFIIAEIIVMYAVFNYRYRRGIDNILVLLIGGLPIAMPTVLSVTMAIGAKQLSEKKAIVTRITAIEELAAVTILCSDKTGTMTLNKLSIDKNSIVLYGDTPSDDVIRYAAYASNREHSDAIDTCVLESFGDVGSIDRRIIVKSFIPFDPTTKRTEVDCQDKSTGITLRVTKGMPEVIIQLCMASNSEPLEKVEKMRSDVKEFAKRGFRSLAVAVSQGGEHYRLVGLLPIFDPPREDTAETIRRAIELGVQVKMITGDQLEIAKETGRRLGMGDSMYQYVDVMKSIGAEQSDCKEAGIDKVVLSADGFASVFPEHKYDIVKRLQDMDHMVAMTGDGVNDAPALAKANVGVAVADACDAARTASAIVLTEPGLSVIIDALLGSRQIFARMTSYSIYTCSITIRIILSFSLLIFIFQYDFPPFMILILAIFNDGTIMTIANDRVKPSPEPTKWRLKRIFISAIVYGIYLTASTLVFFAIATRTNFFQSTFGVPNIQSTGVDTPVASYSHSIIYLQVSIISQALIFTTRSQGFFFTERPTILLVIAFIVAQLASTLIAVYSDWEFTNMLGCGWSYAGIVWVYDIIWFLPLDFVKFGLQMAFARSATGIKPFNQCHEGCLSKLCKGSAIAPENATAVEIPSENPQPRRLSRMSNDVAIQTPHHKRQKPILNKINELGEFGAPYYTAHTDILSGIQQQGFMARSFSTHQ